MSASSSPTLAPLMPREHARLIATVDLPTPPFPEATAIACLTPGMTWFGCRRLKAERTLAVIFRSTAVTPGRSPTSLLAIVWKRSRTGQAGVVSSKVKLTRPSTPMTRSLIMPRLTTSRPSSGSWIAESTDRTCSELGGALLLSTEDHRRAQRQHPEQDEDGHDQGVGAGAGDDGRFAACGTDAHMTPGRHQRGADPDQREQPQREVGQGQAHGPGGADRDEERHQQDKLKDREVTIRLVQAAEAEHRVNAISGEERDQRGRAAQTGGQEQAAQHPRVAPDRLVADAEQNACVGGDEQSEDAADDVEGAAEDAADRPAGIAGNAAVAAVEHKGLERGHRREGAEYQQSPDPHGHRRPVLEVEALVAGRDVDEHVPELRPASSQVDGQKQWTEKQRDEARVEAGARCGLIARIAHQTQKRRQRIAAPGEAGEEEVAEDVPGPLRRSYEMFSGEVDHEVPRRLKATMPAITPRTPVTRAARYPPMLLRVGSLALSAFGSPYVSGLSMSRKKAFSPP